MREIICQHTWPFVPAGHHLNTIAYLSFVADYGHPFMTILHPVSNGCLQQDDVACCKTQITSVDQYLREMFPALC